MKQSSIKFSIKTICIMLVATLCLTAVFMLGFSQNPVAEAANEDVVAYFNSDFSGMQVDYSSNETWTSFCNSLDNRSIRFFASFSVQNNPEFTKYTYIDLNGQTLTNQSITISGGAEIYDYANNGGCAFHINVSSRTTLYKGGTNTLCSFNVENGAKLTVLSGKIQTMYVYDGKVNSVLPSGYCFIAHNRNTGKEEFYTYAAGETPDFNNGDKGTYDYMYVQKCTHEEIKDGVCVHCGKTLSSQDAIETAKSELAEAKAELVEAINKKADQTTVDASVKKLQDSINTINNTLADLGKKDTELEKAIADAKSEVSKAASDALDEAKTELTSKINTKADQAAVDKSIGDLQSAIDTINKTLTALGEKDTALEKAIADAKSEVSKAASDALDEAKTELTSKINTKADQAAVDKSIGDLQSAIDTINKTLTALGEKDTALETAIADAKKEVSDAAADALDKAKTELTTKINTKADQAAVDKSIGDLQSAINTINSTLSALGDKDTALEKAIADAKTEVSKAASDALDKAKTELTTKINAKANQADVDESINDLQSAINTINNTLTALGDKDTALEKAIADAKKEVSDAAASALDEAKTELTTKINTKADQAAVDKSIGDLQSAIATINNTLTALGEKDTALETAITNAKKEVSDAAADALDKAKTELTTKINTKADQTAVDASVKKLQDSIDTINKTLTALGTKDSDLETAITNAKTEVSKAASDALEKAKTELTTKINAKANQADVDQSVADLNAAIDTINNKLAQLGVKGSELDEAIAAAKKEVSEAAASALEDAKTDLTTKINAKADKTTVDEAVKNLNAAIANLTTTSATYADDKDAAMKEEIEAEIAAAKAEAVKAASDALASAKTELTTKIDTKASTAELNEAINNLTAAIENAKTTNDKYVDDKNTSLKSDFTAQITEANTTLEDAIDKLSKRLDSAEERLGKDEAEIKTLKTVVMAAWGVMLAFGIITVIMVFGFRHVAKLSVANGAANGTKNGEAKTAEVKSDESNADNAQTDDGENE